VLGERAREVEITLRGGRAKNRLGKLAIAIVAARFELRVEAAAAGCL
jgi:hypothetical protein